MVKSRHDPSQREDVFHIEFFVEVDIDVRKQNIILRRKTRNTATQQKNVLQVDVSVAVSVSAVDHVINAEFHRHA